MSSYWIEKYKFRFDAWAADLASRAGIPFEPYGIVVAAAPGTPLAG